MALTMAFDVLASDVDVLASDIPRPPIEQHVCHIGDTVMIHASKDLHGPGDHCSANDYIPPSLELQSFLTSSSTSKGIMWSCYKNTRRNMGI